MNECERLLCTVGPCVDRYGYRFTDSEFQCMWRGCSRIRKGVPPFPKMERLLRHIREVHIQKNQGRVVSPADRSKYNNRSDSRSLVCQHDVTLNNTEI